MKKIFVFIFLFFASKVSLCQYPIVQNLGSDSTLISVGRNFGGGIKGNLINTSYSDTTAANLQRIRQYAGGQIFTTGDTSLWLRSIGANKWVKLAGSAGVTNIYNTSGTLTGNRTVTGGGYYLAFDGQSSIRLNPSGLNRTGLIFVDYDSIRLEPPFGILTIDSLASGASTDSVLVWTQSSGRVKKRSYSAFTPTWQQTLTAGSTLTGSNTIAGGGFDFTLNNMGTVNFNMANTKQFKVNNAGTIYLESINGGGYTYLEGAAAGILSYWDFHAEAADGTLGDIGIQPNMFQTYINGGGKYNEIRMQDSTQFYPHLGKIYIDTVRAGTTSNTLLGWTNGGSDNGKTGYVTLGSGLSLSSGVLNTSGTVATPISSLTAATQDNTLSLGTRVQTWNITNTGGTGYSLGLVANTTSSSNSDYNMVLLRQGVHASSSLTTGGLSVQNTHTGTGSVNRGISSVANNGETNIAGIFSTTGGTNNYAIIVPASSGSVGIGTSTPTSLLHVVPVHTTGIGAEFISSTTTSGTILDITGTSTALAAGNEGLNIGISGANGTNGITATGARISVTNTNATSGTNVGLDLTASGATTANNALNIAAGAIALNGSAGTSGQVLTSAGANTLPTWSTPASTSPAGNFGNLQINRNGAFTTPASDSLDFESATGLIVTGDITATNVLQGKYIKAWDGSAYNTLIPYSGDGYVYFRNQVVNFTNTAKQESGNWSFDVNGKGYLTSLGIGTTSPSAKLHVVSTTEQLRIGYDASNYWNATTGSTGTTTFNAVGSGSAFNFSDRVSHAQGADVASVAGAISLGTDGNLFEITGTNSITLISNVGWQNGSEVTLMFTSTATLVNGTATSGTDVTMLLAGGANFSATANDVITLVYGEIGGTVAWREKSRSVN